MSGEKWLMVELVSTTCPSGDSSPGRIRVFKYLPEEWAKDSENAHRAVFGEIKPASWDRITYTLLAVCNDLPQGYVTVREVDPEAVYWQFGGMFWPKRGTPLTARIYRRLLEEQGKMSKFMTTYIENTNSAMLRLALSEGLQIIGVRNARGSVLVEFFKEWA